MRCENCEYDLTGLHAPSVCPECGWKFGHRTPRQARLSHLRWGSVSTTVVLSIAAIATPAWFLGGTGLSAIVVLIVCSQLVYWLSFPWTRAQSRRRAGETAFSLAAWFLSTPGILLLVLIARGCAGGYR